MQFVHSMNASCYNYANGRFAHEYVRSSTVVPPQNLYNAICVRTTNSNNVPNHRCWYKLLSTPFGIVIPSSSNSIKALDVLYVAMLFVHSHAESPDTGVSKLWSTHGSESFSREL
jgi:hypothetical protein